MRVLSSPATVSDLGGSFGSKRRIRDATLAGRDNDGDRRRQPHADAGPGGLNRGVGAHQRHPPGAPPPVEPESSSGRGKKVLAPPERIQAAKGTLSQPCLRSRSEKPPAALRMALRISRTFDTVSAVAAS